MNPRTDKFRSKTDAMGRAQAFYGCKVCGNIVEPRDKEDGGPKPGICSKCKSLAAEWWRLASKAEAKRFGELVMLRVAGKIRNLRCQVPIPILLPKTRKKIKYIADFAYRDTDRKKWVYEDVKPKGFMTAEAKIKMMLADEVLFDLDGHVDIIER